MTRGSGRSLQSGRSHEDSLSDEVDHDVAQSRRREAREEPADVTRISPAALRARLLERSGRGERLDATLRARLGPMLGFDPELAGIHQGPQVAEAASRLGAEAFTIGSDVFFASNQFRPTTLKGLGLLAHELTHVGQQGRFAPTLASLPRRVAM